MGGVVHDGGPLCRVYFGDPPLLKVLSSDLHLGNGEGDEGKELNDKSQMTKFKWNPKSEQAERTLILALSHAYQPRSRRGRGEQARGRKVEEG